MASILLLNGPNLNLLGTREPAVYGGTTLKELETNVNDAAAALGHSLDTFQSNVEGDLVNRIHTAAGNTDFILFNPGAFTHTSVALRDAILGTEIAFIEIHISNVYAREEFRQQSYFSDIAVGTISGLGTYGYELALLAANNKLKS